MFGIQYGLNRGGSVYCIYLKGLSHENEGGNLYISIESSFQGLTSPIKKNFTFTLHNQQMKIQSMKGFSIPYCLDDSRSGCFFHVHEIPDAIKIYMSLKIRDHGWHQPIKKAFNLNIAIPTHLDSRKTVPLRRVSKYCHELIYMEFYIFCQFLNCIKR